MTPQQIDAQNMQIKNLAAQCDGLKQMLNEANTASLSLRTSNILLQQNLQEMAQKNKALTDELTALKAPPIAEAVPGNEPSASE